MIDVLAIEDSLATRKLLERVIPRVLPWRRTCAVIDGLHARDAIERGRPLLVLLDLVYQDNGIRLLAWMKAHEDPAIRGIPVIVLSGSATANVVQQMLADGAAGFLSKYEGKRSLKRSLKAIFDVWFRVLEEPR